MARPKIENPASVQINLRMTPDDRAELGRRAEAAGMTLTAYLVKCGLAGPKRKRAAKGTR